MTPGKRKGLKVMADFARGCGGQIVRARSLGTGIAAFYGVTAYLGPLIAQAQSDGRDWYYIDNAYFGRMRFWRVTRKSFQHCGIGRADRARLRALGLGFRPWRRGGRHILVCPQSDAFMRLVAGMRVEAWTADVESQLRRTTDREIRVRGKGDVRPLAADLRHCHALVTHMSNAAVEAVCAGVPVFTTGDCAASIMGLGDLGRIETPAYPDGREEWAAVLAANQWTGAEMRSGTCWRALKSPHNHEGTAT